MLVYDKRLLKVTRLNEIVAPVYDSEDIEQELSPVGYLYCDLSTYKQLVTLSVRFEDELAPLTSLLLPVMKHEDAVNHWAKITPSPFNMLAPYLGLITDRVELSNEVGDLASYLHVIGKSIDFAGFVTVPAAARVNVSFGKATFLMKDEEVRDYKRTLREREKAEYGDGVTWVSTEEVRRVLDVADMLKEITSSGLMTSQQNLTVSNVIDDGVDEEDDWAGYIPPVIPKIGDWDLPVSPKETVNKRTVEEVIEEEESIDILDKILQGTMASQNI